MDTLTRIRLGYFWGNIGASCLTALLFIVWSFYKSGAHTIFSSLENISSLFFGSFGVAITTFIILWFFWIFVWGMIWMSYCLFILPATKLAEKLRIYGYLDKYHRWGMKT